MWGTHITEEGMASVFVAVDHCSVDSWGSMPSIRQGVAERFAGLEAVALKVRQPICPMTFSGRSPTWA